MANLDRDHYLDKQGLQTLISDLETSIVAEAYSSSATYALGSYCIYNNLLYRCTTAITTAENWNSAHWLQIVLADDVELKTSIQSITTTQWEALSPAEQASGSYVITDAQTVPLTAEYVPYDNSSSGFTASNVQDAIDELSETLFDYVEDESGDHIFDEDGEPIFGESTSGSGGNADYVEITQAEYDQLSYAEKHNGKMYFITDGQGGGGGASAVTELTDVLLNNPTDNDLLVYDSNLTGGKTWKNAKKIVTCTKSQYDTWVANDSFPYTDCKYIVTDVNNINNPTAAEIPYDSNNTASVKDVLDLLLDRIYPVGSIYMSVTDSTIADVEAKFGGTWIRFGAGRTLVGYDSTQTEFNTIEGQGGEKVHTLTVSEMPGHTHIINQRQQWFSSDTVVNPGTGTIYSWKSGEGTGGATSKSYRSATNDINSTGGGGSHNNLQPYIVVYMYKRTA